ncbi:MAG: hypothetical protein ABJ004_14460 [Cyclobacteriaceae bacterium]
MIGTTIVGKFPFFTGIGFVRFLVLFGATQHANAQTTQDIPDIEKVYLHTDRDIYVLGETLWYKAYQVYAYNHYLFDNSKLLYVELISGDSEVVLRNVTALNGGEGHGDMALTDSLGVESGRYQLRAYTNWSRNFGSDFIFEKNIEVLNLRAIYGDTIAVSPQNEGFEIQFFPEGGALIEGVTGQVAFKAVRNKGLPCEVIGWVLSSKADTISSFRSTHEGMGSFVFTPEPDENYIAHVFDFNGQLKKVKLQSALKIGYTMSVIQHKAKTYITIKTNRKTFEANPNEQLTIAGSCRGITYFEGSQPLSGLSHTFMLPSQSFPEGICRIKLLDGVLRPHSERLVFIEKDHKLEVSVSHEKKTYKPREKVNLQVTVRHKDGLPVNSAMSISVVDRTAQIGQDREQVNISSYLLLESDIRGKVHNSTQYFDLKNPTRLVDLDLLLLTQGWRDFLWRRDFTIQDTSKYELERSLNISGQLRKLFVDTPIPETSVNLMLGNTEESIILSDTTNELGEFNFDGLEFRGLAKMMLNSENVKGKSKGWLVLDSLYNAPVAINFDTTATPFEANELASLGKLHLKKHIEYQVPLEAGDRLLDELVVTASKTEDDPFANRYGVPDESYVPEDGQTKFSSILTMIQFSISGVLASSQSLRFSGKSGDALIILDGAPIDMDILIGLQPSDVSRIEALKYSGALSMFGSEGANGVLLVYTKTGNSTAGSKRVYHSIDHKVMGFYKARVFYSPSYEENGDSLEPPDIRNTLFWHPYIRPNEEGKAQASYFNSDLKTTVDVLVEGITDSGVPFVTKTSYQIDTD